MLRLRSLTAKDVLPFLAYPDYITYIKNLSDQDLHSIAKEILDSAKHLPTERIKRTAMALTMKERGVPNLFMDQDKILLACCKYATLIFIETGARAGLLHVVSGTPSFHIDPRYPLVIEYHDSCDPRFKARIERMMKEHFTDMV